MTKSSDKLDRLVESYGETIDTLGVMGKDSTNMSQKKYLMSQKKSFLIVYILALESRLK